MPRPREEPGSRLAGSLAAPFETAAERDLSCGVAPSAHPRVNVRQHEVAEWSNLGIRIRCEPSERRLLRRFEVACVEQSLREVEIAGRERRVRFDGRAKMIDRLA